MRRRPYFLLPDVPSARLTANDLLLARVGDRHMHFLAKRGQVLLMVDVPYGQVEQIRELVLARHPEALSGGQEARIPAFP